MAKNISSKKTNFANNRPNCLKVTKKSQKVNFAKTSNDKFDKIVFENQTTHVVFELTATNSADSDLVYTIDISSIIDEFETGQYDYSFMDGDSVVNSGILQFDGFEPSTIQYENRVEYIQYTPE